MNVPVDAWAPGWWTETQLRSVLGQGALLDDLTSARDPTGEGVPEWTCHFTLGQGRGGLAGVVRRHATGAAARQALAGCPGVPIDDEVSQAKDVILDLTGDGDGGVVHRLAARDGRMVVGIELEIHASRFVDRSPPPDAGFVLLELLRLIRL